MTETVDVIVLGTGAAGLTAAARGAQVGLFERTRPGMRTCCWGARVPHGRAR